MYRKLGLVQPVANVKDMGRFDVTKNEADKYFFKVPSLRNIEKTAPYLHDGSVTSLEAMVAFMGQHQLGKELTATEVTSIVGFLKSLTGALSPQDTAAPKALASGKATPKPDPS